tara:strand:+ start:75517 stop:75675 length:159 start_codon:yes stop_codon:yes gene_type:complete
MVIFFKDLIVSLRREINQPVYSGLIVRDVVEAYALKHSPVHTPLNPLSRGDI